MFGYEKAKIPIEWVRFQANGRYGIPFDLITPDTFGEKFGGGRIPAGTRGYTWSNWAQWLAPSTEPRATYSAEEECTNLDPLTGECKDTPEYREKQKRGLIAITVVLLMGIGAIYFISRGR